jgi:hypothetical protein
MAAEKSVIPKNDGKFDDYFKSTVQLTVERMSGTAPEWPRLRTGMRTGICLMPRR